MKVIETYKDFNSNNSINQRFRRLSRNTAITALSFGKDISARQNCIQFPYYHHVFNDEKKGFYKQLKYLKNFGDFISMDEAVDFINGNGFNGRYFCVSFDDGFYNTYANMLEITDALDIPIIIYLPTNFIGLKSDNSDELQKIVGFYPEDPKVIPFLTWEHCREMLHRKVSFGSHTSNHVNLSKKNVQEIKIELSESKEIIEAKLEIECNHFACPWGRIGIDFTPSITTEIAKQIGYKSFATTNRGIMRNGDDPFTLKRDHLLANWGIPQLKYFFGA